MKTKLLVALLALGVMLLAPVASRADTCVPAIDNITNVSFEICYSALSANSITLTAVHSLTSGFGDPTKLFSAGLYGTGLGFTTVPTGFGGPPPNDCCDGFASPNVMTVHSGGSPLPGSYTFTWTGTATTIIFHVGGNPCSAFVGLNINGGSMSSIDSQTWGTDCGTPVPEPGSLALLGSGLVGAAAFLRRRFLR